MTTEKSPIVNLGKIPPQAIDIEEAVLGSMMVDRKGVDDAIDLLRPEVFFKDSHQHIFGAIQKLYIDSQPIDLLTISNQLKSEKKLDLSGGDLYLIQLTQKIASSAHIDFHSRIVLQKYIQRQSIAAGSEMIEQAYDEDVDALQLLDRAYNRLGEVTNLISVGKVVDFAKTVKEYLKVKPLSQGVRSSIDLLNKKLNGYQNTDLIIIAARPGMGKTAFVLNEALSAALRGEPVLIFSLEMSDEQLIGRLLCIMSGIDTETMRSRKFTPSERDHVQRCADILANLPIHIDDTPSLSTIEFKLKANRMVREKKIKMIMVDYLQLMTIKGEKSFSRENEISKISGTLKETAKRLNVPVIALSQLSRKVEERGASKRPLLSDLRDGGTIEQDADIVIFIYRPEYYKIEEWDDEDHTPTKNTAEIEVAKFRNGSTGPVLVGCQLRYMRFMDKEHIDNDIEWKYLGTPKQETSEPEFNKPIFASPEQAFTLDDGSDVDVPF